MARIIATGTPENRPGLGPIRITIEGGPVKIESVSYERKTESGWEKAQELGYYLQEDLKKGPSYPLCADPFTMRCALFVLFEWFGEAESCWVKEPEHVKLEGEIEPMEYQPGVIY